MRRAFIALALCGIALAGDEEKMKYPETKRVDQVDDYHGTKVEDPYRWLEDADSPETAAWVKAQNELTFSFLEKIPVRAKIKERLTKLWDYERFSPPEKEAGRFFYFKNDGLQNQAVLWVTESLDQPGRVLLDPNKLSSDGTVALGGSAVSEDGKLLAYGLARSGSDWNEWHVRSVETGEDLPDKIEWIKFSGASWTKDGKGFFYSRYDEPKEGKDTLFYNKLFYHRLGTKQSEDELVYKRDDEKEWGFGGQVTEDGHYLVISVWKGTDPKNQVYVKDLRGAKDAKIQEVLTGFEHGWDVLANDGTVFWFKTDQDAPRGRIVKLDITKPAALTEVVPQADETIESVSCVGDRLLVSYLKDAHTRVRVFELSGKHVRDIELPGLGSAGGFGGRRTDKETFYSYTSFTTPNTIYRYDVKSGESTLWRKPKVEFDPDGYESKMVMVPSKDGTKVPLWITHRKDLKLDGGNPTYLTGYGGFNVSITPYFSVANQVWMEQGGVFASANLRGGGEYGEAWHKAGTRHSKQNVFDDFMACARWLEENGYASPKKLAIAGGSNGGLLVGACLVQHPELFGAALPDVGVLDMLRFHKFTIGWAWVDDYGSSDDPEDFKSLLAYSPYHNVKPGTNFPPVLITTADHDDRVVPGHSFKFTAALQAAQAGPAPVLIRIETKAGHGAGKPTQKLIDELADEYGFLLHVMK
jgi:prolyl oligopeptidase